MGFGPISQKVGTRVQAASVCHFQHRGTCQKVLNVGAVTGLNPSPVPTLFGLFSAALILFSFIPPCVALSHLRVSFDHRFQLRSHPFISFFLNFDHLSLLCGDSSICFFEEHARVDESKRLNVSRGFFSQCTFYGRNPLVACDLAFVVLNNLSLTLLYKSLKAVVNWCKGLAVLGEIESEIQQSRANVGGGYGNVTVLLEDHADTIRKLHGLLSGLALYEGGNLNIGRVFVLIGASDVQAIYELFPLDYLGVNYGAPFVEVSTSGDKFTKFLSCYNQGFL
jgi:hypothetical protein